MKTVKVLIAIIFMTTLSWGATAQDKYEYATVTYRPGIVLNRGTISISKEGKFETSEFKLSEGSVNENFTPAIETLNKLNLEGWEVFNTNNVIWEKWMTTYYQLRKKKN